MIKKLRFWFWMWKHSGYTLVPKWYKNLSVHWSKKEQKLQRSLGLLHKSIGANLIKSTDDIDWGDEIEYVDLKPIKPTWQMKMWREKGIDSESDFVF